MDAFNARDYDLFKTYFTEDMTIRRPLASAATNARSVASAWTVAKTAAVPVPAAASAPKNRAEMRAA